jgi:hypothetical protein
VITECSSISGIKITSTKQKSYYQYFFFYKSAAFFDDNKTLIEKVAGINSLNLYFIDIHKKYYDYKKRIYQKRGNWHCSSICGWCLAWI